MRTMYGEVASALQSAHADYERGVGLYDPCHIVGHCGSPELIEYIDGVFITFCNVCSDKMVLEKVPGEFPKMQIQALLLDRMSDLPLDLGKLREAENALRVERAQLEYAESQLKLIKDMIRSNYASGSSSAK